MTEKEIEPIHLQHVSRKCVAVSRKRHAKTKHYSWSRESASMRPAVVEDTSNGDRFLVYSTAKGVKLDVRFEGETLCMTQAQMAELFGATVATVSRHIANIFEEGELDIEPTLKKIETVRFEGSRQVARSLEHDNLDMIISVRYRVSSAQATIFRKWATSVLVQYAKKGL